MNLGYILRHFLGLPQDITHVGHQSITSGFLHISRQPHPPRCDLHNERDNLFNCLRRGRRARLGGRIGVIVIDCVLPPPSNIVTERVEESLRAIKAPEKAGIQENMVFKWKDALRPTPRSGHVSPCGPLRRHL